MPFCSVSRPPPRRKNDAEESIIALGTEVLAEQDIIMVEHPASLMSVYLKMVNEVEYPEVPRRGFESGFVGGTEEYRRRFWERVDFFESLLWSGIRSSPC